MLLINLLHISFSAIRLLFYLTNLPFFLYRLNNKAKGSPHSEPFALLQPVLL